MGRGQGQVNKQQKRKSKICGRNRRKLQISMQNIFLFGILITLLAFILLQFTYRRAQNFGGREFEQ